MEENQKFELSEARNLSDRLLQITGLILAVNLGITVSSINPEVLEQIKYQMTISTIFFLISIFFGVFLSSYVIEWSKGKANIGKLQKISKGQFWFFLIGMIFMGWAVLIRVGMI